MIAYFRGQHEPTGLEQRRSAFSMWKDRTLNTIYFSLILQSVKWWSLYVMSATGALINSS